MILIPPHPPKRKAREVIARLYPSHRLLDNHGQVLHEVLLTNTEETITAFAGHHLLTPSKYPSSGMPVRAQLIWREQRGIRGWRLIGHARPALTGQMGVYLLPSAFNATRFTRNQLAVFCGGITPDYLQDLIARTVLHSEVANFLTRGNPAEGACSPGFTCPLHEAMCCIMIHSCTIGPIDLQHNIAQVALLLRRILLDPLPSATSARSCFHDGARAYTRNLLVQFQRAYPASHRALISLISQRKDAPKSRLSHATLSAFALAAAYADHTQLNQLGFSRT